MHDLRFIREDPAAFDRALERRRFEPRSEAIISLDAGHRSALTRAQELQARRNKVSKEIGAARSKGGDASALMAQMAADKDAQAVAEEEARVLGARLEALLAEIPNLPADDVPDGADETANVELRRHGVPAGLPQPARDHVALGEGLGLMDFDRAARLSGARFVVLRGALARLERALGAFMLDLHTAEFGYTETSPPILVRDSALFGTGQLPKFGADLFKTSDNYWLIPTAEVPLTNLVADEIVEEPRLPIRMTALTPCFRSEAGAAGKDTRGMIRQHQFQKVELVSICRPEDSAAEHERMTGCAEEVLKRLGLPYRVIVLCTGDMGFSARKTYDIEVWIPSEGRYREISSCSNCGDFQARRMKARYRPVEGKGNRFVHTLNGSGLAVGRTLIAVVENYQQADGSILIPEILRPYLGGQTRIGADG